MNDRRLARPLGVPRNVPPKLTIEMVARLHGWKTGEWEFAGRKTAQYRQIGNAFPPPVAEAIGNSIAAFDRSAPSREIESVDGVEHDDLYRFLRSAGDFVSAEEILSEFSGVLTVNQLEARIANLSRDFVLDIRNHRDGSQVEYLLGDFLGVSGQEDHLRHEYIAKNRSRVS